MIFKPHAYQVNMINHIDQHHRAFVLAAAGSGKTATVLAALQGVKQRILIIAPLRVAKHTWPDEIDKWGFGYSYNVAIGTPAQRKKAIETHSDILIINIDNIVWLLDSYPDLDCGIIVLDESSTIKSASTKRFKKLGKYLNKNPELQAILMTATPTPNSLLEAWTQMFCIDGGQRLGKTFTAYKNRYFDSDYMGYKWEPRPGAEEKIHNLIAEKAVVVESYDGLPELVELEHYVSLPDKAMKAYKEMVKEMLIELEGSDISAVNAAVLVNKLAQFASGAVYDDDKNYHVYHDEKIEALAEILEEAGDENVLVAYNYKHEYERIVERFPHAVSIKESNAIKQWNEGNIKLLLAHPKSAGHGLNLQDGGRRIVWFAPTWSNESKIQFDARLYRQGQDEHVFIHTIIAEGTVDEDVVTAVAQKKNIQDLLLMAVKNP